MKISDLYDLPIKQEVGCLISNDCRYTIRFDESDSNCGEQVEVVADALNSHDLLVERVEKLESALKYYKYECSGYEPSISVFQRMIDELEI
tara:strand:- start:6123 stop:6395 length:273 start_codon:yes stop_codon:yes gene_type:complete